MAEADNDDDDDVVEKSVTEEVDGIANAAAAGIGSGLDDEDLGLSSDLLCRHSGPPTDGAVVIDVGGSLRMMGPLS